MTTTANPLFLKALDTLTTEVASLRLGARYSIQAHRCDAGGGIDLLPSSRRRRHLAMTPFPMATSKLHGNGNGNG